MIQTTTVLTEILALILGRKYYANIIHTRGTNKCEVSSFIFRNKQEADDHRNALESNLSYKFVETVSFRSRREYSNIRNASNKG
ncbi:MAG: hypothetical protein HDS08_00565 [Bacteroides sp.]|nr:hypothetical protein [Bacteroides sp.]